MIHIAHVVLEVLQMLTPLSANDAVTARMTCKVGGDKAGAYAENEAWDE